MTHNAANNGVNIASLAASGSQSFTLVVDNVFEVQCQISVTFGTVAATSGLQVSIFRQIGSTPVTDNVAITLFTIASVASSTQIQSFSLPTGKYSVTLKNLDATNAVTSVTATFDTVSSVA